MRIHPSRWTLIRLKAADLPIREGDFKDSGLRIRVQRELREKFLQICRTQDKSAAQVIREFMRAYVGNHEADRPAATQKSKPLRKSHEH